MLTSWTMWPHRSEIVTDYNHAKDRTTIENTFRELVALANSLDEEQKRATREGLSEEELALFDILLADGIDKADREHVKRASRELLAATITTQGSVRDENSISGLSSPAGSMGQCSSRGPADAFGHSDQ